jgi:Arc/MetJ family transcription regulator
VCYSALGAFGIFVFCLLFVMMFFMVDGHWVAPTVLSPTSDRMLQYVAGYQQAVQNLRTLGVARSQAERDYMFAQSNARVLHALDNDMHQFTSDFKGIDVAKSADIEHSRKLADSLEVVKKQTALSLKSGLITNQDAVSTLATIQSFDNSATDGNLALKTAQLRAQVAQADNDVHTKRETLDAAIASTKPAQDELKALEASSYFTAYKQSGSNLAFLPYDNYDNVKAGDRVYDCRLLIVFCHAVGTIAEVYADEQVVDFPIFNVRFARTMRGVFVNMNMLNAKAMRSIIIFTSRPPLYF